MEGQFVYKYYGLVPREFITSLSSRLDLVPYNVMTVFSSMFLHGGFSILAEICCTFGFLVTILKMPWGMGDLFSFIFWPVLLLPFAQLLYDPASNIPMIGASGAVSGVLGAYLVLYPYARIKTLLFIIIFIKVVELPAVVLLTIWFFMQVLYSSLEGVAWYAHIGGFIFGLVTIKLFSRKPLSKGSKTRG